MGRRRYSRLKVDDRELEQAGESFTVDTLASLREEVGDTPICLIIGMDQFHSLDQWHEWRKIIALAHICVARRPGSAVPTDGPVAQLLSDVRSPTQGVYMRRRAATFSWCGTGTGYI